ncbi:hypothetical protein [Rhizobium sp. BK251]|uniref:hypothetical protein n=1 Tax=Rhizobium sp. BK251 TaxID=2512125 RepID=UPI001053DBF0|nr:hypothetical protein [Rhizobium sp. BK251]TCL70668.1 hypothetical protein EV286_107546 [Rhizobium sp. BK251]
MSEIFGSLIGDLLGSPRRLKATDNNLGWDSEMARNNLSYGFLKTHKTAYSFEFRTGRTTYWRGFYASKEELEEAFAKLLLSIDYKPRRFWQFWRYGETPVSRDALKRLSALKESTNA